jgi:hypothetical protein
MILLEVEKHMFEKGCLDWGDHKNLMENLGDVNSEDDFFSISCEIYFHYNCLRSSGKEFNFLQWTSNTQDSGSSPYLPPPILHQGLRKL